MLLRHLRFPAATLTWSSSACAAMACMLSGAACRQPIAAAVPGVEPCVYLGAADGSRYSLGYAGSTCDRPGFRPLPVEQFDSVDAWAFNAQAAGFLPAIAEYRIDARLASLDERSSSGFSVHGGGYWQEYQWGEWTVRADLVASDAAGDSIAAQAIEDPLSRAGLATGHGLELKYDKRKLSGGVQAKLVPILAAAEGQLQELEPMRRTTRTLDEAVQELPDHAAERRKTFTRFTLY